MKQENEVNFKNGTKLSDHITCLPHGVINKTVTGIGATTLEAVCPRNSIIVEPTRAIVTDKARQHKCLGIMGGFTAEDVKDYRTSNKGKYCE